LALNLRVSPIHPFSAGSQDLTGYLHPELTQSTDSGDQLFGLAKATLNDLVKRESLAGIHFFIRILSPFLKEKKLKLA